MMTLSKKMIIKRSIFIILIFLSLCSTAEAFWILIGENYEYADYFEIKVDSNTSLYKLDYLLENDDFSTNLNLSTISTLDGLINVTTIPDSNKTLITYDFTDCLENGQINSNAFEPQFYPNAICYDLFNYSINDIAAGYISGPTISTNKKPLLILINHKGTNFKDNLPQIEHFLPYEKIEYDMISIDNEGIKSLSSPLTIPNIQTNGEISVFFDDIFISLETNQTIENFEVYPSDNFWFIDEGSSFLPVITVDYDNVTQMTNISGFFATKVKSPYLNLLGFKKEGNNYAPDFIVEYPNQLNNQTTFILKVGETPNFLKNLYNLESPNNNLINNIKIEIIDRYDIASETAGLERNVNIENKLPKSLNTSIHNINSFENRELLTTPLEKENTDGNVFISSGNTKRKITIKESGNYKIQFSDIPRHIFPFDSEVFYYPISSEGTTFDLTGQSHVIPNEPLLISLKDGTDPLVKIFDINNSISDQSISISDKILLFGWDGDPRRLATRTLTYKPQKISIHTTKEWDDRPKIEILTYEHKIRTDDNNTNFNFYAIKNNNQAIIVAEEKTFSFRSNEWLIKKIELNRSELKDYDIVEIKDDMKSYTYSKYLDLSRYNGAVILIQFHRPLTIIVLFLFSWLVYFIGLTNLLLLKKETIDKYVSFTVSLIGGLPFFYFILSYPERFSHFILWYSIPLVIIIVLKRYKHIFIQLKESLKKIKMYNLHRL